MKNKKENLIVLLFIIIAITAVSFNYKLEVSDELWNFSNMYKMSHGYTIYKDLNVIITPLTFYIGELVFRIFGANFLTSKILNTCIFVIFYFLIYKLFRRLKLSKLKSGFYTMALYCLMFYIIMTGTNYNIVALIFCLIGILLMLENKPYWLQGIIIFLVFMSKQNIGIYYMIGYEIAKLIQTIPNYKNHKTDIKSIIKQMIIPISIFIGLFAVYLIYLYTQGNLYNFINYAFLGIREFGRKNLYYNNAVYELILTFIAYMTIIFILKYKKFNIKDEVRKNTYLLISFAVPLLLIAYPLINQHHVDMAILFSMITIIYVLEKSFLEELTDSKIMNNIFKFMIIVFLISTSIFSIVQNLQYVKELSKYHYYSAYYGALIDDEMKDDINEIVKYINSQENQTIILSYYSNLYMNVLNRNNGKMDLPFYGNLGKKGEDGLINEIDNLTNTNLLILKEEDTLFQESSKVREHIIEKYEQIDEIGRYKIYKIN